MKKSILKIILTIIALAFIFGMIGLAELLASVISINFIMNTVYTMLGFSFVYVFKN